MIILIGLMILRGLMMLKGLTSLRGLMRSIGLEWGLVRCPGLMRYHQYPHVTSDN